MVKAKHRHSKADVDHLINKIKARGERITTVRRDVMVALSRVKEPQRAYKILAELNKNRFPQLSIVSLYRALDFLTGLGITIKLKSQNTYKLCAEDDDHHSHLMIICDNCGATREVDDHAASQKLQNLANKYGHTLKHQVMELHGLCANCGA